MGQERCWPICEFKGEGALEAKIRTPLASDLGVLILILCWLTSGLPGGMEDDQRTRSRHRMGGRGVSAEAILDRTAWQGGGLCASDTCWETPARKEEDPEFSWLGDVNHPHRPAQAMPGGGGVLPAEAVICSPASVSPSLKCWPRAALGTFFGQVIFLGGGHYSHHQRQGWPPGSRGPKS